MKELRPMEPRLTEAEYDAFSTRQRAMVEAGTHPLIADRLARNAVRNQGLRERQLKQKANVVPVPTEAATAPVVVPETVPVEADSHAPGRHA